jgi:hypothetical protein
LSPLTNRLRTPDLSRNGLVNSTLPHWKLGDYVGNTDLVNRIVFNVIGLPIIGLESKEVGIDVVAMRHRTK